MGVRIRKSIKVAPGVRLNMSKTGVGASIGAGGMRYSAHSSGRRTVSARTGVPGVYYQQSVASGASAAGPAAGAQSSATKKPGLFAPKGDQTGRWDDVIELTEGGEERRRASALLCIFPGLPFREQGFHDAAHEALKEALRARSRAAEIRHLALAERAENYLAQGKKSQARKDLERILAEDSRC
jgi:Protein of unknown function (DUF4236)